MQWLYCSVLFWLNTVVAHLIPLQMLFRCTACIAYHSESLLSQIVSHPGHIFTNNAIIHDSYLLGHLRNLVTTDPTRAVMDM